MNIFSAQKEEKKMSSNTLTADQPVEIIKPFKFSTKDGKEEIDIGIPEVSASVSIFKQFIENKNGVGNNAIVRNA